MSKAFTKEDDDIPEPVRRVRQSSELPPGAVNYMTAEGARRLKSELDKLKAAQSVQGKRRQQRTVELEHVLASMTIVPVQEPTPDEVLFGATVTVRAKSGELARYRIVGVDETKLEPGWVSWMSSLAKALIGAQVGQRVNLGEPPPGEEVEIVKIAY